MRNRTSQIIIRLSDEELADLNEKVSSEPFPKKRTQNAEKKWNDIDTEFKRRGHIA